MNNTPIHSPLIDPTHQYGSDDCETMNMLLEVDEWVIRKLLEPTPFDFVTARAWLEIVILRSSFGRAQPFGSGGVIVPARYGQTVGGFYAFCYANTDESIAGGRESFGYPKKYAEVTLERVGNAVVGSIVGPSVDIRASVILDEHETVMHTAVDVPMHPHLLLQVLPSAETTEVLLKRVLSRDTSKQSRFSPTIASESAVAFRDGSIGNDLEWLATVRALHGWYARGAFRSAFAKVLGTEEIGEELRAALISM